MNMERKTGWGKARKQMPLPAFPFFMEEFMAVPRNFVFGVLTGLLLPLAAIVGVVAGIYLFTKKVPFIAEIEEEDEARRLIVKLVEPEEARSLFQKGREAAQAFGDEVKAELEGEQEPVDLVEEA
jgi:hypothetical protein